MTNIYDVMDLDAADWYGMGKFAYVQGQPLDHCPAREDSEVASVSWSNGWHAAQAEARAEGRAWEQTGTPRPHLARKAPL